MPDAQLQELSEIRVSARYGAQTFPPLKNDVCARLLGFLEAADAADLVRRAAAQRYYDHGPAPKAR